MSLVNLLFKYDCSLCYHCVPAETAQVKSRVDSLYVCAKYNKPIYHCSSCKDASYLFPCEECAKDNFTNFDNRNQ